MTDNFDLRKFLSENKPTRASAVVSEGEADKGKTARTHVVYTANVEYKDDSGRSVLYPSFRATVKKGEDAEQRAIEVIKKHFGDSFSEIKTISKALNPEKFTSKETSEKVQEEEEKEEIMNESREAYLTRLVENALGIDTTPVSEEYNDEMVDENPLPKYKNIDELMKNIEYGTNEAAHKYKMNRMKEIADALEAKVTSLEEGENAEHIDQKAVKAMKKDIMTLRKGVEKLEKEYEKKFAKKEVKKDSK